MIIVNRQNLLYIVLLIVPSTILIDNLWCVHKIIATVLSKGKLVSEDLNCFVEPQNQGAVIAIYFLYVNFGNEHKGFPPQDWPSALESEKTN